MARYSIFSGFLFLLLASGAAFASEYRKSDLIEKGQAIAQTYCARCHGIGRVDESPLEQAPPFRRLHERYPIEQLAEGLAEGIVVGHMDMPAFEFQPRQIEALLAYLETLGSSKGKRK